jgi:hypothetical protein
MEIRALTGFNEETIKSYGRSYTPLNSCTVLGAIGTLRAEEYTSEKKGLKVNPVVLILLGIGAYAIYKNLK